jgi:hypothetical protein
MERTRDQTGAERSGMKHVNDTLAVRHGLTNRAAGPIGLLATLVAALLMPGSVASQAIEGTLMEVGSNRAISLGLVILMTEAGDSVTSDVTDSQGRFRVEAEAGGSFVLIASAFGFKETRAGVFELGDDGEMDVEFRVATEAMPIDGLLVELARPTLQHQLIRNGYVRRLQRGLGKFLTPHDIERAPAMTTADVFRGIPGVHVRTIGGGVNAFQGEAIQFGSPSGYCTPTVYLDGVRLSPSIVSDNPLEHLVPLQSLDAAEIYQRPAEIPIEYASTGVQPLDEGGVCGVIVLWTKGR